MAAPPGYGPMQPQAGFGVAPIAGSNFEFSELDNLVIEKVGANASRYGSVSMVFGALVMLGGLGALVVGRGPIRGAGVATVLVAAVPLISAKFYIDAGKALAAVVTTQGSDISLMMTALEKLRGAVRIEAIVGIAAFFLGIVVAILAAANR